MTMYSTSPRRLLSRLMTPDDDNLLCYINDSRIRTNHYVQKRHYALRDIRPHFRAQRSALVRSIYTVFPQAHPLR
jgi:hypothetical protein